MNNSRIEHQNGQSNEVLTTNYIDALSVLSAFAVVMLHVNGVFWSRPVGSLWFTSNLIETSFYFAVPIFFMITGVTLIDYRQRYTTKEYLKKRVLRTLIPFVFWSAFAALFGPTGRGIDYILNSAFTLRFYESLFYRTLNYSGMYIYWFFYPLFEIYLCIPVLGMIQEKIQIYLYMIICSFCFYSVFPFLCEINPLPVSLLKMTFPVAGGYLIYPLLGYVLHKKLLSQSYKWGWYMLAIIGFFVHIFGTMLCSPIGQPVSKLFKGYLNFPAVLQSIGVFILFRSIKWECCPKIIIALINRARPYTLGVYLIHLYVLRIFQMFLGEYCNYLWFRTIGAVGVFTVCILICRILSITKVTRLILGIR